MTPVDVDPPCFVCGTLLLIGTVSRPWILTCAQCGAITTATDLAVETALGPTHPTVDIEPRCPHVSAEGRHCDKRLADRLTRPWSLRCPRCGTDVSSP